MNTRYRRQTMFEPLGETGQERLQSSRALIVGCGALGGSVANILVRAGVGTVALVDHDSVELGNLHRQFLFFEADVGRLKVEAARNALLAANRDAKIEIFPFRFDRETASMLENYDLLIDGTDNFPTRFLMNESAIRRNKPFITAGIRGMSGQIFTVIPGKTACLACLLPTTEEHTVDEFPVLPPIVQLIAAWEASEAIKLLSGNESAVNPSLVAVDLWTNRISALAVHPNERCSVCGVRVDRPTLS